MDIWEQQRDYTKALVDRILNHRIGSEVIFANKKITDDFEYTALVTVNEINNRHGVGVYMSRLFGKSESIISIRSITNYPDDPQNESFSNYCLFHDTSSRSDIYYQVLNALGDPRIKTTFCVPWSSREVLNALALKYCYGSTLCTYIMDDQNIQVDGIPDDLMQELLEVSDLRLAISQQMRLAYEEKYDLPIGFMPPLSEDKHILKTVDTTVDNESNNGVIIGNIWGKEWLDNLRRVIRETNETVTWYSNDYSRWWQGDSYSRNSKNSIPNDLKELERDGIIVPNGDGLTDDELVGALRKARYVIVPTGTMNPNDSHHFIASFSLPSRIPYILSTSNTPILVTGSEDSVAAKFVLEMGIGIVVPYETKVFKKAVDWISKPENNFKMRKNSSNIAASFSDKGALDWLYDSVELGKPLDNRFEKILDYSPVENVTFYS